MGSACSSSGNASSPAASRKVQVKTKKDLGKDEQKALKTIAANYDVSNRRIDQLAQSFLDADVDNSGTIEFKEFVHMFQIKNGVLAKSIWSEYDQDGNKQLDFVEFVSALAETLSLKNVDEKSDWAFDVYDLNKDGYLTLSEIEKCMKDKNVNIPWEQKQLKAIFSDESVKKDRIKKDEFCLVARKCSTLTFPAFVMLDTLKAKAFDIKESARKPDMQKDLQKAREFKKNNL